MPAPKRSTSTPKTANSAKPAAKRTAAAAKGTAAAAKSGAKATATSTRKAGARTTTQAKSAATKTARSASAGAATTKRSTRGPAAPDRRQGRGRRCRLDREDRTSGAKGTATAARAGAKQVRSDRGGRCDQDASFRAPRGIAVRAAGQGVAKPRDIVMLTRERIQETLDDAASRGRVTRKDANELVAELVRRGRQQSDELMGSIEQLVGRGRGQLGAATKRARKVEPVDRLVRTADRARRTAGVGPSFPILGYDDLNANQVQSRWASFKARAAQGPDLRAQPRQPQVGDGLAGEGDRLAPAAGGPRSLGATKLRRRIAVAWRDCHAHGGWRRQRPDRLGRSAATNSN